MFGSYNGVRHIGLHLYGGYVSIAKAWNEIYVFFLYIASSAVGHN